MTRLPLPYLILTIVDHNNTFIGKTLLQKAVYFINEIAGLGVNFRPHYYGPYSSDVAVALENLVSIGFLNEVEERFSSDWDVWGEVRRYTFELTGEGKEILKKFKQTQQYKDIKNILKKLDRFTVSHDYDKLSKAAKIYHIVKSNGTVTGPKIKRKASQLGWRLESSEINEMSSFLERLGLIQVSRPNPQRKRN